MQKYIFLLLLAVIFTACSNTPNESNTTEKTSGSSSQKEAEIVELSAEQAKIAGIKVGKPELQEISARLRVNGIVEAPPQNVLSVTFPLGGYIKSTKLLPGMQIAKGAILATIEDTQIIQLQQDYLMNKAKLEFSAEDYNRQATLNKTKANSDRVYQQAKSDYESQKIQVRALSEKLKLIGINPSKLTENNISRIINIHSPINAYVSKVNVNPGKYVNPTDVLFELIDPSDAHLSLTVFEKEASSLKIGQKVTCFSNDNPDKIITATVYLITPNVSEDRSVEVHCHFDQFDKSFKPGTFINAEIQSNNAKVKTVPDDAIVRWHNQHYIFTEKASNTYQLLEIVPGTSSGGYTEVKSDLGDSNIVFENAYTLLMKLKNNAEEE